MLDRDNLRAERLRRNDIERLFRHRRIRAHAVKRDAGADRVPFHLRVEEHTGRCRKTRPFRVIREVTEPIQLPADRRRAVLFIRRVTVREVREHTVARDSRDRVKPGADRFHFRRPEAETRESHES